MNASQSRVNASSPPPINWATRPARRLVPVYVDADQLQVGELQDYVIINVRHFEEVRHRLSQLESSSRQSQPQMQDLMSTFSSLSVSTSSVASQPLSARAASVTSLSMDPVLSRSLAAKPAPVSTPGISPQVSPRKKRYYVILVGKCAGIYYDDW